MKTLFYDGVAARTDDRVADAVLELAIALARFRQYEAATLPVLVDGRTQQLSVMLGPTIHVSALTVEGAERVDGAEEAAARIRRRLQEITEPMRPSAEFADLSAFD
jgi:hypothetical protein